MLKSRISSKGRITLPQEVRDALGVGPGVVVVFEVRGGEVLLRRHRGVPLERLVGRLHSVVSYPGAEAEREARIQAWIMDEET